MSDDRSTRSRSGAWLVAIVVTAASVAYVGYDLWGDARWQKEVNEAVEAHNALLHAGEGSEPRDLSREPFLVDLTVVKNGFLGWGFSAGIREPIRIGNVSTVRDDDIVTLSVFSTNLTLGEIDSLDTNGSVLTWSSFDLASRMNRFAGASWADLDGVLLFELGYDGRGEDDVVVVFDPASATWYETCGYTKTQPLQGSRTQAFPSTFEGETMTHHYATIRYPREVPCDA